MRYPIGIETGDSKHAYGVVVPDLPGCFSAGETLDEALTNAMDAILLHLECLLDDGQSVPKPSTIEHLRSKRSYRGWTWAIVDVERQRAEIRPPESTYTAAADSPRGGCSCSQARRDAFGVSGSRGARRDAETGVSNNRHRSRIGQTVPHFSARSTFTVTSGQNRLENDYGNACQYHPPRPRHPQR